LPTYIRYAASTLPSNVGSDSERGTRLSDGRAGHVSFGPYLTLEPGVYCAGFRLRSQQGCLPGQIDMDVSAVGIPSLAHRSFTADGLFEDTSSLLHMEFSVAERVEGLEVRLYAHENVLIEIEELVVFSLQTRNWGGR
jgi:hypothetical protein